MLYSMTCEPAVQKWNVLGRQPRKTTGRLMYRPLIPCGSSYSGIACGGLTNEMYQTRVYLISSVAAYVYG